MKNTKMLTLTIFLTYLILNEEDGAILKTMKLKESIREQAKLFDEAKIPAVWEKIYKRDKGVMDENDSQEKVKQAKEVYSMELRRNFTQRHVKDFAFPLRFCINPEQKFNQVGYCMQTKRVIKERRECLNQFCSLCCGIARDMLISMANKYTTAKELGLTLTPGENIIKKLITEDEKVICSLRCNMQQPIKLPLMRPAPPKIKDLGENENPANGPVAWSCTDVLRWNIDVQDRVISGQFQIKINKIVHKAQCDLHNGGWTLFFHQVNQGVMELSQDSQYQGAKKDVTEQGMFPQHVPDASMRQLGEKQVPIKSQHISLKKAFDINKNEDLENATKVQSLWFFCASFKPDPEKPFDFDVLTMSSFTTDLPGPIYTAFSENRQEMEDVWLLESRDLEPFNDGFGDFNDDDDTSQFYALNYFRPKAMFDASKGERKANKFRKATDPTKIKTDKSVLKKEGFHNTLFRAEAGDKEPKDVYKWSVRTEEVPHAYDNKNPNDGIWNCDSDYAKATSETAPMTFIHQVQFKTYRPSVPELEERADLYKLWPKP